MGTNFFVGNKEHIENLSFAKRVIFEENDVVLLDEKANMWDVLVHLGVFKSKGQARKNWRKDTKIADGYTDVLVGKKKRRACIWKPIFESVDIFDDNGELIVDWYYNGILVNKNTSDEVIQELTDYKEGCVDINTAFNVAGGFC